MMGAAINPLQLGMMAARLFAGQQKPEYQLPSVYQGYQNLPQGGSSFYDARTGNIVFSPSTFNPQAGQFQYTNLMGNQIPMSYSLGANGLPDPSTVTWGASRGSQPNLQAGSSQWLRRNMQADPSRTMQWLRENQAMQSSKQAWDYNMRPEQAIATSKQSGRPTGWVQTGQGNFAYVPAENRQMAGMPPLTQTLPQNPFTGFNQQPISNPFVPQQPRPQQPPNQAWLNMIGR